MSDPIPIYIGKNTISAFMQYCHQHGLEKFLLVSDLNTYQALGESVEGVLKNQGYDVIVAIVEGDDVIANEESLVQVFLKVDQEKRTFLGVGSGTITDITRFVSHRARSSFISLPTAPSVDGYTSIGSPLVIGGIKKTILCQPPIALFADLPTLCASPPLMIAAGFGDMIGKLLSTADWKLGHILWDEPFDEAIWHRSRKAAFLCAEHAEEIGLRKEEGVRILMEGLIESGLCMLDFGNSSPASGAEHHISHFWEMKLLRENRPPILHGAKVGVASVITSGWYESLQDLSQAQAAAILKEVQLPDPKEVELEVRAVYSTIGNKVIAEQAEFIHMNPHTFTHLKKRIVECWHEILDIADQVPSPRQITEWLQKAKGPISTDMLLLKKEEVQQAINYSHYERRRFSINKLRHILGMDGMPG